MWNDGILEDWNDGFIEFTIIPTFQYSKSLQVRI